jgi:hypothetical protein
MFFNCGLSVASIEQREATKSERAAARLQWAV